MNYASEIDAIRDLCRRGYSADLEFRDDALHEIVSGRRFRPDELAIVEHHRFEGASDPEDMSVVYAIESDDGVHGIVMDAFGAMQSQARGFSGKGQSTRARLADSIKMFFALSREGGGDFFFTLSSALSDQASCLTTATTKPKVSAARPRSAPGRTRLRT
jgi:hypothetical protein